MVLETKRNTTMLGGGALAANPEQEKQQQANISAAAKNQIERLFRREATMTVNSLWFRRVRTR